MVVKTNQMGTSRELLGKTIQGAVNDVLWSCVLDDYMSEEDEKEFNKITPTSRSCLMLNSAYPATKPLQEDDPRNPSIRAAGYGNDEYRDGTLAIWHEGDADADPVPPPLDWLKIPPAAEMDQITTLTSSSNWNEKLQRYESKLREEAMRESGRGRRGKTQDKPLESANDKSRAQRRTRNSRRMQRNRSKSRGRSKSKGKKENDSTNFGIRQRSLSRKKAAHTKRSAKSTKKPTSHQSRAKSTTTDQNSKTSRSSASTKKDSKLKQSRKRFGLL